MPSADTPRLKLRLAPAAEAAVRSGHPWVFDRAIRSQNRDGKAGEVAVLYDRRDRFLALGFYDPDSPIRVRILHAGAPVTLDAAWWHARFLAAVQRRFALFGQPASQSHAASLAQDAPGHNAPASVASAPVMAARTMAAPETSAPAASDRLTDGYRLIHGESDGWPGLVLDRYADTLVMKLYAAAWLPRLGELVPLVRESLPWATALVLRLSRNLTDGALRDHDISEGFLFSAADPPREIVLFSENGLRFEAGVRHGQKTGFFLDQRDNRARVEALAAGRDVLNAFSFSGGFSLYAARGHARSVTDLDLSGHALAAARRNFALNREAFPAVAACSHETVQADAFAWLARPPDARFDLIIIDPPSLARRESERPGALDAYSRLHASALARLRPGGILVAASCSAHVDEAAFFALVRGAARASRRPFRELWTSTHAADHPAAFPEARYLKCLALQIG